MFAAKHCTPSIRATPRNARPATPPSICSSTHSSISRRIKVQPRPNRSITVHARGNGGNGGNDGPKLPPDGPGPNNGGDSGDDGAGRIPAYLFVVLPLATYFLHTSSCSANGQDLQALKRLMREAFAEIVSVKSRLTSLETVPDSDDEESPEPRDGVSIRAVNKKQGRGRGPRGKSKVHLGGHLELAAHVPWTNVGSRGGAMQELASAGVRSGPLANFTMQKLFKQDGHSLLGKALLHADGSVRLMQAVYKVQVIGAVRVMLAALGGSLAAVAPKLNPFSDTGLTRMTREGHDVEGVRHQGTGVGVCLTRAGCSLSAASLVQGAADGSLSHVLCAQVGVTHPTYGACHVVASSRSLTWLMGESLRGSISGVSESSDGFHSSTHGSSLTYQGLLPPCNRRSLPTDPESELAISASVKLPRRMVLSGWAAASSEGPQLSQPWGLSLQALPDGAGQSMIVAVGVHPTALNDIASVKNEKQVVCEVSAKLPTADGLVLVPGVVLVQQGSKRSMTASVQTLWRF